MISSLLPGLAAAGNRTIGERGGLCLGRGISQTMHRIWKVHHVIGPVLEITVVGRRSSVEVKNCSFVVHLLVLWLVIFPDICQTKHAWQTWNS